MADNTRLPIPNTSGDEIAADDIGGVKFQRIKMIVGDDGVNDGDVSSSNPLPITGAIAEGAASNGQMLLVGGQTAGGVAKVFETNASGHLNIADGGGSITVDATSLPLPTGAATETTSQEIKTLQESILAMQTEIKDLNDTLLVLLSSILEKMPRVTGNDQAAVTIEGGTLGTLTTLTTCATLTNQTQIGGQEALSVAKAQMMQGTSHIYNNITVA